MRKSIKNRFSSKQALMKGGMMNNKKGISAIVATVLIILITVAAVTIIWAAIIPMINSQLGGSTKCFEASASLAVLSDYSCYNASGKEVSIQIGRSTGDFDLAGIEIIASYEGTSETVEINGSKVPDSNGERVYTIVVNASSSAADEFALDGIDEASVAAIVKVGNTQKTCDSSGSLTIGACA